jgi:hypothetical protein
VPVQRIVLKFSEHRFPFVKAKPIHGSQKIIDADDHTISLNLIPNRELEAILLSFGDDVEVIEPQPLRLQVANKIKKSFEKYFSVQKGCTDGAYLCNVEREHRSQETQPLDTNDKKKQIVQKHCTHN